MFRIDNKAANLSKNLRSRNSFLLMLKKEGNYFKVKLPSPIFWPSQ